MTISRILSRKFKNRSWLPAFPFLKTHFVFISLIQSIVVAATALLFAYNVGAGTLPAEPRIGKTLPGEACRIGPADLPVGWSESEKWTWKQICEGRTANFNTLLGEELDPQDPNHNHKWSDGRRTLSSDFLQAILLHEPYRSAVPDRGVWIVAAFFEQGLNLDDAVLQRPLMLHSSQFNATVSMGRVRTQGMVSFNGSRIKGKLDMDSARVGGHLLMKHADFAEVRLAGAKTDGQLSMVGSTFSGLLQMDYLMVGGSMLMTEANFSDVHFSAGLTKGQLSLVGSIFSGALDMELVTVGESLLMRQARFEGVRLTGAKIAGQLSIGGSTFGELLKMDSMTVGQNLHMEDDSIFEGVVLRGTKIGGQLALRDAAFKGLLEMDSVNVGESMYLQQATFAEALLDGAQVRGQLVMSGSTFIGLFQMNSATIGEGLYMSDGSTFNGLLEMDSVTIGESLRMRRATFAEVRLTGANIHDWVWLDGSTFNGFLQMDSITVGESLYMRQAAFAKVRLRGAIIGGQLSLQESKFNALVDMGAVTVGANLLMSDGATFAEAVLTGAEIGNQLVLIGSTFSGLLTMDSVTIGGHLLMGRAQFLSVNLLNATIGGAIELDGSTFKGPLNMDSVKVGGSLFMREGVFNDRVVLVHASVGGNLDAGGSSLGELDLRGARIARELRLGSSSRGIEWKEYSDGNKAAFRPKLNLLNAAAGALQDTKNTWPKDLEWELDGFTYSRFGGLEATESEMPFERGADWFIRWLEENKTFSPQPYQQLAKVLRQTGHEPLADEILFALQDRIRNHDRTPVLKKALLMASCALLGYGYEVWRAGVWFFGLVLLGFCILCITPEDRRRGFWHRMFYSLGTAVPLIGLIPIQEEFSRDLASGVAWYFVFHRILGLVIVSALIAGMTGLVT